MSLQVNARMMLSQHNPSKYCIGLVGHPIFFHPLFFRRTCCSRFAITTFICRIRNFGSFQISQPANHTFNANGVRNVGNSVGALLEHERKNARKSWLITDLGCMVDIPLTSLPNIASWATLERQVLLYHCVALPVCLIPTFEFRELAALFFFSMLA